MPKREGKLYNYGIKPSPWRGLFGTVYGDTMNRPLVWLGVCFALGIVIQHKLSFSVLSLSLVTLATIILTLYLFLSDRQAVGLLLFLFVLCGCFRVLTAEKELITNLSPAEDRRVVVRGEVVSQPLVKGEKLICDVLIDSVQLFSQQPQKIPPEKLRLYIFKEDDGLTEKKAEPENIPHYGDMITASGKLVLPRQKRNPGEFDYRDYLHYRKIFHLLYVYQPGKVSVIARGQGNPLMSAAFEVRDSFSEIVRGCLPERQAGLLLGILFGEQGGVFEEDLEVFRETGIAHALSVSGFHVGLVLLLVLSFCRATGAGTRGTIFSAITALVVYCLLSGFSVTVVRATIMGVIALLAHYFHREKNIFIALAASGMVILFGNPFFLFDLGFQLSFAAVWAIAYLEPWLGELLPASLYGRGAFLTVPLAAQLGTLPIIACWFNIFSPLSVVVNILLVPLMSGIVIIGLCSFILSFASAGAAETMLHTSGLLLNMLIHCGERMAVLPGMVYSVAAPSPAFLLLYYVLLVTFKEIWERKTVFNNTVSPSAETTLPGGQTGSGYPGSSLRRMLLILGVTGCLLLGTQFWPGKNPLFLYFLDVGQGDAILICCPSGTTVLIDGGGMPGYMGQGYDPGEDTVVPFLRRIGINSIDLLVNTHPDEDHLDGLEDVLREVPVERIVTPPAGQWKDKYAAFFELAGRKRVPCTELTEGDQIKLEKDVFVRILGPPQDSRLETSNDSSLVLEVCHGKNKFLLLGDLERAGLASLMKGNSDLDCTLLKLPHHGSGGSFDELFYRKTHPEAAIISVGEDNPFGHPSREVIQYWENAGVPLFRTDQNGGITVVSDGRKCAVESLH